MYVYVLSAAVMQRLDVIQEGIAATQEGIAATNIRISDLASGVAKMSLSVRQSTEAIVKKFKETTPTPDVFFHNLKGQITPEATQTLWTELNEHLVHVSEDKKDKRIWKKHINALQTVDFADEELVQAIMSVVHAFVREKLTPDCKVHLGLFTLCAAVLFALLRLNYHFL